MLFFFPNNVLLLSTFHATLPGVPHVNQKPTKWKENQEITKQAYKHRHFPNPLNHLSKSMIPPGGEVNQGSKMNRSSLTHMLKLHVNTVELQALKILEERYWN
ncbi:hypothetical protein Dsin_009135 [Dipteronia sinensis]|uniref:Uncharacterized protein n=1 Tax=Dipteronia sinensis TaxID=43782 RepID=A0AAE0AQP5_9ROSI|nr:hypothetical protein Dsin_009135 [Dipteronia sinensis]